MGVYSILFLNAQKFNDHIEYNTSYTIRRVPNWSKRASNVGYKNVTNFEFAIKKNFTNVSWYNLHVFRLRINSLSTTI